MTETPQTPLAPDEDSEATAVPPTAEAGPEPATDVVDAVTTVEGPALEPAAAAEADATAEAAVAPASEAPESDAASPVARDTGAELEVAAIAEVLTAEPRTAAAAEPEDATPVEPEPVGAVDPETVAEALPEGSAAVEPETLAEASSAGDPAPSALAARPAPRPSPRPTPPPGPRPTPASVRPGPRPGARAAGGTGTASAPALAPAPVAPVDPAEAARAAAFGRVDAAGTVFVTDGGVEREVGQFPGATPDEALSLYVRRFLDLQAKVVLFESRLAATDLSVKEIDQTLGRLTEELEAPAAVGDLAGLRERLESLRAVAAERRAAAEAERAAAREAAAAARTELVEQAEKIAETDPARIQWRPAGEQLRTLLDQWKEAQRSGPRLDRATEESLWKRFSHARTTFDRERRHFFAELESRNAAAKTAKESLVAHAERLVTSTDWGATAGAFRDLMTQWKAAGRASRPVDDALWTRFRVAQDAFFAARDAANQATDTEYQANLVVKEALLAEAEALLPVRNLAAVKTSLRSVQERWEAAGKVPRGDVQRIEARMRAVEQAVREADDAQWRRSNPETRARAEGAAAQLEQAIASLEADLERARTKGDARAVAEAQAALDARRSWLEQVQRAARDARG